MGEKGGVTTYYVALSPPPDVQYAASIASRKLLNEAPSTESPV